jgi:hypothetical protein
MTDLDLPDWTPDDDDGHEGLLQYAGSHDFSDILGLGAEVTEEKSLHEEPSVVLGAGEEARAPARAESARLARQRRIALRRDRTEHALKAPSAAVPVKPVAAGAVGAAPVLPAGSSGEEEDAARRKELEKEIRSAAMKNTFLTKQNSQLTQKLEAGRRARWRWSARTPACGARKNSS